MEELRHGREQADLWMPEWIAYLEPSNPPNEPWEPAISQVRCHVSRRWSGVWLLVSRIITSGDELRPGCLRHCSLLSCGPHHFPCVRLAAADMRKYSAQRTLHVNVLYNPCRSGSNSDSIRPSQPHVTSQKTGKRERSAGKEKRDRKGKRKKFL